ncbi:DNA polymerase I [Oscillochloris trichoides DG-6]|uniref:DNA polymerase I n=1 Tax=Oscillochloris trichoides DG-6 TaxID=765420 RepID=E1IFN1_9CHLR|nr:DNA polymerase I [Oscillochloris trichoides]EFO80047.1 DNA polymerase I [Oscillochloris trichoides DG-6]
MTHTHRLVLVDGHALAFRAFHALKESNLRSSRGEPTYAVYGFAQILLSMIQEQQPTYVVIAFDVGRTFRDDLYAEYKAGRAETPEEFHPQLVRIQELCRTLNIPIATAEGFEADDVIGTLARLASAEGLETLILTGDTDALQLVNAQVRVILANPYGQKTTTTIYDEAKVRERYQGLGPHQLADLRGLKGDASDNIPGVRGIGEKGAISLLNQFGTVENLFDHLPEVPKRYQKPLDGQREVALFSKKLATIVADVPVQLDLAAAAIHDYDRAAVIRLFQELEFGASSGLIKKLPEPPSPTPLPLFGVELPSSLEDSSAPTQLSFFAAETPAPPVATRSALGEYRSITTSSELADLTQALAAAPGFAFDTEASGLRPFASQLCGISLALSPGSAVYVPCGHSSGAQLSLAEVVAALGPFFADPNKAKYAHNAKFDIEMLLGVGIEVQGLAFDTMIAAALLGKRAGLKDLAFYELQLPDPMTPIEDLIGRGTKQISFAQVPIERATPYAAADADMTLRLVHALEPQLATTPKLHDLYRRLELPLVHVLVQMEQAGIALDKPYIEYLGQRMGTRIAAIEQEIYQIAEGPFNINSSDQLSDILFGKIGLSTEGVERTAKTKKYSITADTLERLRERDTSGICERILEYRRLSKLKSTYVDALPALVNPRTGRVHTTYNQVGAATGRLSSNDPNLQNIPVRTQEGREIRRGFVAAPGHRFIAADYSQIELRVLAYITKDPNLVRAFQEGQDIHAATAAQLFGVAIDQVDKEQRRIAKTVVFGVIYGISAFGLAQRTEMGRSEAQDLINSLFTRFPGIRDYINRTLEQGQTTGVVQTIFGRQRAMPELQSRGPRRAAAEREAINAPIQGTAADIMKIAMIKMARALSERGLRTRLLLQVHDELILEAPEEEVALVAELVREVMAGAYSLAWHDQEGQSHHVPLGVDVEIGPNWEEMG